MFHKHRFVSLLFVLSCAYIVLTSSEAGRAEVANVGNTGAPTETQLCSSCHNSGSAFGTVTLTIQVFQDNTTNAITAYVPGTLYDMRVTVNHTAGTPAGYGFQMTCLTTPGNSPLASYSALSSNVQMIPITTGLYAGRTYVEQPTMSTSNQFNFSWTAPPAGTGSVKFYAAGNAVNGNNSSSSDKSGNTNLTLPELLPLAQTSTFGSPTCAGQHNGFINLTITGGLSPYTYLWSNGATTQDLTNLDGGTYSVTTTDNLGSTIGNSFTLTEPMSMTVTVDVINPLYPGENGEVSMQVTGGNPGYTYEIDGIGTVTEFPLSLPDGVYSYTVTDSIGCHATGEFEVVVPEPMVLFADINDVSCFGLADGSADVLITGATAPYEISWSNGDVGTHADNLTAAVWDVLVTDEVGYTLLFCVTVDQPDSLTLDISTEGIACANGIAQVTVNAVGGTGPFNGAGLYQLAVGDYAFNVTDANGCEASAVLSLSEPLPLILSTVADTIPCSDGSGFVDVSAEGGTLPYSGTGSFEVTQPGSYVYEVTDGNGCTAQVNAEVAALNGPSLASSVIPVNCPGGCTGQIGISPSNTTEPFEIAWQDGSVELERTDLCAGTYSMTFTDGGGCVLTGTFDVNQPDPIQIVFTSDPILCFGDTIALMSSAQGGTGPYSWQWTEGSSSNVLQAGAGVHHVELTDSEGCQSSATAELTQPIALSLELSGSEPLCNGSENGSAIAVVEGGTEPFSITWSNGDAGLTADSLATGMYSCFVTDLHGCGINSDLVLDEPLVLSVTVVDITGDTGTMDGTIDIQVNGGTEPYTYLWSTGASTEDVTGLFAAGYAVQVTDASGCMLVSQIITVPTGVEEYNQYIHIYPNPVQDELIVESDVALDTMTMYDATGALIWSENFVNGKRVIPVHSLAAGMYMVVCHSGNHLFRTSVLKY